MKKMIFTCLAVFMIMLSQAQTTIVLPKSELLLKAGVGFVKDGMPAPLNFTLPAPVGGAATSGSIAFPKTKAGFNAGIDYNYFFNSWIGASATADFFSNGYKKIEASAPFNPAAISFTQKNQTNTFVGLGPIARFPIKNKFSGSVAIYGGYLWHSKHSYQADYTVAPFGSATILSFASNKALGMIAMKGSVRVDYAITPKVAISAGVEYIHPFISKAQSFTGLMPAGTGYYVNLPSAIQGVTNTSQRSFDSSYIKTKGNTYRQFEDVKLNLLAFNIGIKFRLGVGGKKTERTAKKKPCCGECPIYGLAVTAKDKYTKEVLPNTDVAIKNTNGEIVKTGKTNAFGIVVFDKILKSDYTVSGLLNNVALENNTVQGKEFVCDEVLQKEIVYSDRNFIITGKAVVCNTSSPLSGITVSLENKGMAFKRSTLTDQNGSFVLQLPEKGVYDLYGKKDSYFSQVEQVTSGDYNRDKTLFVKLEICAEKADCGKAINLKNILFDLDKYEIKPAAAKELDRLVQFMKDNPSISVELGSHTDCRNTAEYNQRLSENRAKASVDYLVSQGISRDRLVGIGYGETKLLNRCADGVSCSEAEHAINRRTEMKVICPNSGN